MVNEVENSLLIVYFQRYLFWRRLHFDSLIFYSANDMLGQEILFNLESQTTYIGLLYISPFVSLQLGNFWDQQPVVKALIHDTILDPIYWIQSIGYN